jgi:hypothetical protein
MSDKPKLHATPVGPFKPVEEKYAVAITSGGSVSLSPEKLSEKAQADFELGKDLEDMRNRARLQEWEEQIKKENAEEAKRIAEQERQERRKKAEAEREAKQKRKAEGLEISKHNHEIFSTQTAHAAAKREQELVDRAANSAALITAEITKLRSYFFAVPEHRRNELPIDILVAASESLKKLI